MLYNELDRMIKKYDMINLALSSAKENILTYISESPENAEKEGFIPPERVICSFDCCKYTVTEHTQYISAEIEMRTPEKIIGYYTLIFDSGNGVITDDIFYTPF